MPGVNFSHGNRELWSVGEDGKARLIKDIYPGYESSSIDFLGNVGEFTYFIANDGTHGRELWRTDGTPNGTELIRDLVKNGDLLVRSWLVMGNLAYFSAVNTAGGDTLYRTDGTARGTFALTPDANHGVDKGSLHAYGRRVLFVYRIHDDSRPSLWISGGKTSNTIAFAGTSLPAKSPFGFTPLILNDHIYLISGLGRDPVNQLWRLYPDDVIA
jgi:ELWxxDGT repeat protein